MDARLTRMFERYFLLRRRAIKCRGSARKRAKAAREAYRACIKLCSCESERAAKALAKHGLMLVDAETRGLKRVVSIVPEGEKVEVLL